MWLFYKSRDIQTFLKCRGWSVKIIKLVACSKAYLYGEKRARNSMGHSFKQGTFVLIMPMYTIKNVSLIATFILSATGYFFSKQKGKVLKRSRVKKNSINLPSVTYYPVLITKFPVKSQCSIDVIKY